MESVKMTNDDFAKFMANIILEIENYNFDVMYDIAKIMNEYRERRNLSDRNTPDIEQYYLCVRATGCDIFYAKNISDGVNQIYKERAKKIYKLDICFNYDWLNNTPFCTVTTIKNIS